MAFGWTEKIEKRDKKYSKGEGTGLFRRNYIIETRTGQLLSAKDGRKEVHCDIIVEHLVARTEGEVHAHATMKKLYI